MRGAGVLAAALILGTAVESAATSCVVSAQKGIQLGARATTAATLVVSGPKRRIVLGRSARAEDGTVLDAAGVRLGRGASVSSVRTDKLVSGRGAAVRGQRLTTAMVAPTCETAPACDRPRVRLAKGATLALPPGTYGAVRLAAAARLQLANGSYRFCELRLGAGASVLAPAGGSVQVAVARDVRAGASTRIQPAVCAGRVLVGADAALECPPALPWRFEEVASAVGIAAVHSYADPAGYVTGGLAAGDVDRDGWVDVVTVGGTGGQNRLWRNRGDGTFVEATTSAMALPGRFTTAPLLADWDGDGALDLLFGGVYDGDVPTPVTLLRGTGDGGFTDVTAASGVDVSAPTHGAAFGDIDGDGDLDLYLAHWLPPFWEPSARLWKNVGAGRFVDVTLEAGVNVVRSPVGVDTSFAPTFADVNRDGHPDLLVAADYGGSFVLLNDGDGTFRSSPSAPLSDENGMGSAVGDFDEDGDLDWFVTSIWDPNGVVEGNGNWGVSGNRLYQNRGDGTFDDVTDAAGVRAGFWGWAACAADLDLDGHLDLFHVNGFLSPAGHADEFTHDPSRLFVSNGDGSFTERSASVGLADHEQGRGVACFDYDHDGDVDVFVANNGGPLRLWRNDTSGLGRHWLSVRLRGNAPNTEAVGAWIEVTIGAVTQVRELRAGNNYASQDPAEAHFGLGTTATVDRVRIRWPSGAVTTAEGVLGDRRVVFDEPVE